MMDWTDEAVAKLRKWREEGLTRAEIARRFGISKNAVIGKIDRLRLAPSPLAPASAIDGARAVAEARERTARIKSERTRAAPPVPPLAVPVVPKPLPVRPCCWPIGDTRQPGFRFCGDPAAEGRSYCAMHATTAYVRIGERRAVTATASASNKP